VAEHLCRLLAHMDAHGHEVVVPEPPDPAMETRPLLDFSAGYVQRSLHELPRAGAREPWQLVMSYYEDVRRLRRAPVEDAALRFSSRPSTPAMYSRSVS
jgi:monooxygenase